MKESEIELAAALHERRAIIGDETSRREPEKHLEKLKAVSEKIEALGKSLPPPVDPQLAHYLARCSYDKALETLEAHL
ncbi:MAG TPA: hypothetical protein VH207_03585 [Chthoniobacterales bacterium]|jgi:hypothetical protein|nr:hypothetical protein [Chthoniobacterales bacterium]